MQALFFRCALQCAGGFGMPWRTPHGVSGLFSGLEFRFLLDVLPIATSLQHMRYRGFDHPSINVELFPMAPGPRIADAMEFATVRPRYSYIARYAPSVIAMPAPTHPLGFPLTHRSGLTLGVSCQYCGASLPENEGSLRADSRSQLPVLRCTLWTWPALPVGQHTHSFRV